MFFTPTGTTSYSVPMFPMLDGIHPESCPRDSRQDDIFDDTIVFKSKYLIPPLSMQREFIQLS